MDPLRRRAKQMIEEQINQEVTDLLSHTNWTEAQLRNAIGRINGMKHSQQIIDEAYRTSE